MFLLLACTPPDAPEPDPPEVVVSVETGDSEPPDSDSSPPDSPRDSETFDCYGVHEGDLHIGTEVELDDLQGIIWVDGSLTLQAMDDVGNLSSLRCLERVSGNVVIQENANFRNLLGLDALRQVDGSLSIRYNPELQHTDHLGSLASIGNHMLISDNDVMTSVVLASLETIEVNAYVEDMPLLEVLRMPALRSVNQLNIKDAPAWDLDLTSLESATLLLYDVEITDFSSLSSLVSGSLTLYDLPELTSVAGLSDDGAFTYVQIAKAPKLTSLDGLAEFTVTQSLTLRELPIQDLVGVQMTPNTSLNLYSLSDLTSLQGLNDLKRASAIKISGCPELATLDGLDALEVLSSLSIQYSGLTSLDALGGLTELVALSLDGNGPLSVDPLGHVGLSYLSVTDQAIEGTLYSEAFDALYLTDAEGSLSWTATTGNRVSVQGSDVDLDLSALDELVTSLTLDEAASWPDLSALQVVGTVSITDSPDLPEVTLPQLRTAADLELESLDAVETVDLGSLERATSIRLSGLDVVTQVDLGALEKTDSVEIRSAFELVDLDLGSLTETGSFNLTSLWALEDLSGLALQEVDSLTLYSLVGLTSVSGLEALTRIDGKLYVRGLDALDDFQGMGTVQIETLELRESAMSSLDGLEGITVTGDVTVSSNDALLRVDGLSGLTAVDDLNFSSCDALQTIEGLEGLTEVGSLTVYNNAELTSIDGLFGLTSVARAFKVKDNTSLATADAEALRDAIGTANIGSTITISGNGS